MKIAIKELTANLSNISHEDGEKVYSRRVNIGSVLNYMRKSTLLNYNGFFTIAFPDTFLCGDGEHLEIVFDAFDRRVIEFSFVKEVEEDNIDSANIIRIDKRTYSGSLMELDDHESKRLCDYCRLWLDAALELRDKLDW